MLMSSPPPCSSPPTSPAPSSWLPAWCWSWLPAAPAPLPPPTMPTRPSAASSVATTVSICWHWPPTGCRDPTSTNSTSTTASWRDRSLSSMSAASPPASFLGTIQALFESVIYIFIFLWTPVLDPHGAPLGIVFSGFMAASMLGSSLYHLAVSKRYHLQPVHLLSLAVLLVFFSLFMLTFSTNPGQESPAESFLAFLLIELSCGLYFPAMGFLRRKVVPEKDRLGVMNWFRLPLNLLACLGLLILHDSDRQTGTRSMFGICAAVALLALLAVGRLFALSRHDAELRLPVPPGQADGDATPEL